MVEYENCPICGKDIPEGLKPNFCPFCGVKLYPKVEGAPAIIEDENKPESEETAESVPVSAPLPAPEPAQTQEEPQGRAGIAWENRPELSILQRLTGTWTESLFNAVNFFKNLPLGGRISLPFLYGFIFIAVGNLFSIFWESKLYGFLESSMDQMPPLYQDAFQALLAARAETSPQDQLLLIPMYVVLGLFLSTIVLHVMLMMTGGAKNGFITTFRVSAYTSGVMVFMAIPLLGPFIAIFFGVYITVIGLREGHETVHGKALFAVLAPLLTYCCLTAVLATRMLGA